MTKHGGGYVILDLRDAELNNGGTESTGFVNLTEQQVNVIKTAADEKLPVLYIGRGSTGDGYMADTVSAAFTFAMHDTETYNIGIPVFSLYSPGFSGAMLNGNSLNLYQV